MPSLNQFAWVAGSTTYRYGHRSIPNIPITGAPPDADLTRWAMLHDNSVYRFYCFKRGTSDRLYQFGFNGASYAWGHSSIPELVLEGFPADADASSFAMLHDGSDYRLYLHKRDDPRTLYQAAWVAGTSVYRFGHNSIPAIPVVGFPADTDWSRWMMLHDGQFYRHYAFRQNSNTQFYQGAFNRAANRYEHGFNSIPVLTLEGTPADSDTGRAAMLHDNADYRFYFQTRTVDPAPTPTPTPTPAPGPKIGNQIVGALNSDGRLEVFGIGAADGRLHNIWQTRASAGPWSAWGQLGGVVKQIAATRNQDGRLEVFGIGSDDGLYNIWQTRAAAGPWSGWKVLGPGGRLKRLVATRNADGRLEVLGIGMDDGLYNIWQTAPNNGWSSWGNVGPGGRIKELAVATNQDGRLEVFGIGMDNALWHIWQTRPAAGPWSAWASLGGGIKQLVAARNGDGRLEIFAIGSDDALWHIWQTAPNNGWSAWASLGGKVKQIAAANNQDGRLEVFGIGFDDALWHIWQTKPSAGPWSAWASRGGTVKRIAAAHNQDGRLEAFGIGTDDALWNIWQQSPNGNWSGWNRLG